MFFVLKLYSVRCTLQFNKIRITKGCSTTRTIKTYYWPSVDFQYHEYNVYTIMFHLSRSHLNKMGCLKNEKNRTENRLCLFHLTTRVPAYLNNWCRQCLRHYIILQYYTTYTRSVVINFIHMCKTSIETSLRKQTL